MKVVISQSMYFPWVGFIGQLALADVLIWLDDVQFSKGSFTNRVQVKGPKGQIWITVPLLGKGSGTQIRHLVTADENTEARHKATLYNSLGLAPFWQDALRLFEDVWASQSELPDILINSAEFLLAGMGVKLPPVIKASDLRVSGAGSQRICDLVKEVGGTTYITGHGAKHYLDHMAFEKEGISVLYMDYASKPWPQQYGDFTPYVTALDLIANVPLQLRDDYLPKQMTHWVNFLTK
jgi:hypothetical protein